jgi:hypothetical protein
VNHLSQLAAVFAIVGGVGLLAFSRNIDPAVSSAANPEIMMNSIVRGERGIAAYAAGWGTALITPGSLTMGGALGEQRIEAPNRIA